MIRNKLAGQLTRFSFTGLINTVVGYTVIAIGLAFGLSPYTSNIIGYLAGLLCSFYLNRSFVFKANQNSKQQVCRFILAFLVSFLGNFLTLHLCLLSGLSNLPAFIISAIVYSSIMFYLSKVWVFNKGDSLVFR